MKRALALLPVLLCSSALAESGAYRVEVIVFRHLAVAAEATPVDELRNFAQFPGLLEPVLEPVVEATLDEVVPAAIPDAEVPGAAQNDEPQEAVVDLQPEELEPVAEPGPIMLRPDLPDGLVVVEQKSPAMDDAWRRLRGSREYRPLLYTAWEQSRVDYGVISV